MKVRSIILITLSIAMLSVASPSMSAPKFLSKDGVATRWEQEVMSTISFLNAHPDLKYMNEARKHLVAGDYVRAAKNFDLAGYFGDKLSQGALAELYWEGKGVSRDRAKAYAIADMASERMNNTTLIAVRERYWDELTEPERLQVNAISKEILQRYSDEFTTKRLAQRMRSGLQSGRVRGYGKDLSSVIAFTSDGGEIEIRPQVFHADKFWDVKQYVEFKDQLVEEAMRDGKVRVKFQGKVGDDTAEQDETQGKR